MKKSFIKIKRKDNYYADDPRAIKDLKETRERIKRLDQEIKAEHYIDNRDNAIVLMWKRGSSIGGIARKYGLGENSVRSIIGLALYEE